MSDKDINKARLHCKLIILAAIYLWLMISNRIMKLIL